MDVFSSWFIHMLSRALCLTHRGQIYQGNLLRKVNLVFPVWVQMIHFRQTKHAKMKQITH